MPSGRTVVVAVPGLSGGVDEAARHLFGSPEVERRWQIRMLVTKGQRARSAPLVFGRALARLLWWRLQGRVDLLHLNVSSRGSAARKLIVGTLARSIGVPYVIQLHGGGFDSFYRDLPAPARALVRWFFAGAGQVFVLGRSFGELVEGPLGVAADRVSILRNSVTVPPGYRPPDRPDGPPLILFTGRLGPGKGIPELLDALARLPEIPWTAVLAGDGEVEGTRARAAELGLGDRLEVRGWQSRDRVTDLLAAASIFVLPSHLEALSVALLEAMAAGLCCVATPVGAHGEIVEHEVNGLLVEPGDLDGLTEALTRALTDDGLRARLGCQARASVESTCSNAVVAEQLSTTYERVLTSS